MAYLLVTFNVEKIDTSKLYKNKSSNYSGNLTVEGMICFIKTWSQTSRCGFEPRMEHVSSHSLTTNSIQYIHYWLWRENLRAGH